MTLDGQTIVQPELFTVTVKVHEAAFSDPSTAVQLTVVTPIEKWLPEAGLQLTVAPQLSDAVGVE